MRRRCHCCDNLGPSVTVGRVKIDLHFTMYSILVTSSAVVFTLQKGMWLEKDLLEKIVKTNVEIVHSCTYSDTVMKKCTMRDTAYLKYQLTWCFHCDLS